MMNNISLMIYLAEVCERIQGAAGFLFFMGGLLGGVAICFLWGIHLIEKEFSRSGVVLVTIFWTFFAIVSGSLAAFTPSQKTLYLIAASEAGEVVVKSQETQEIFNDLKSIIKQRLKAELGEGK